MAEAFINNIKALSCYWGTGAQVEKPAVLGPTKAFSIVVSFFFLFKRGSHSVAQVGQ